jgi:hypothetical protein
MEILVVGNSTPKAIRRPMNGKGSSPRGQSREERKRFEDGWEAAFGRNKKKRSKKKPKAT